MLLRGWLRKAKDYRGVPALIMVRRIPNSPWYLSAKIDVSEVEAPLRRLSWEMAAMVVMIGVANAAGVGLIWRSRQLHIHRQREQWFRTVANDTPAYLWMWSPTGSFINMSVAAKKGTSLAVETEPGAGLRSGLRWAQEMGKERLLASLRPDCPRF